MLRGILAILAGLIVILVTSFGIEAAVTPLLLRMFPAALPNEAAMSHNLPVWLFTFSYTFLCVVAGGYVTARLAPHHNVRHALILGIPRDARLPRQSSALGLDCIDDPRDPRRMVRWTPLRPASTNTRAWTPKTPSGFSTNSPVDSRYSRKPCSTGA